MRIFAALMAFAALLLSAQQAHAQMPGMEIHVVAGLEAETLRPAPGSTVTLAITMRPDAGWHGYWSNPGDAGEGLSLDWKLPAGVKAGEPRFPVPETLIISGFMNYVYERPHAILVDVAVPANVAVGTKLPISAQTYWLACTDRVCVPQQGILTLELTVGDGKIAAADRARFDAWRAALPVPLDKTGRYSVKGSVIEIAIPFPATASVEQPYFFPTTTGAIDYVAEQKFRRKGDTLIVSTRIPQSNDERPSASIEGLLRFGDEQGLLVSSTTGSVPAGGEAVATKTTAPAKTPHLAWLLLGALAGGLLLNIMPCVFPILGLKALALAKVGGHEREARADALAYSVGVVLSCLALGGIMLALRAGGEEVGWAFQLQEPGFVLFLFMLMVGITANLLGLFNLGSVDVGGTLTRQSGLAGSFWTGALAAVVATPCTGPFMAAALGAALLLPTFQALLLFAALGVGIALPFIAIAYVPRLRAMLPKPGPWLATFRKTMAIPMGLTALALFWLLWRLTGNSGVWVAALTALGLVAVLAPKMPWITKVRRFPLGILAGSLLVLLVGLHFLPTAKPDSSMFRSGVLKSQIFSADRLATLRAEKKPVFVYFTADWCVTCKINEAAVLEREETAKLFSAKGITVLRGDFTKRSPAIARFLSAYGAAGVPLYLYYPKGGAAQKLPQILTETVLREAITG